MPSIFSRTPRGHSNPPIDRQTHAAATAAAVLAAQSHASLSSSAAAAALRSRTTTPEPVGSLVTKRMARRGSVSSVASSAVGGGTRGGAGRGGGMHRTNSGGSMTERTFRVASPGGSERRYGTGAISPAPDAPPVPVIPRDLATRGGVQQRSSSMEPPQRVMSPTHGRGGRGVSVDRGGPTTPVTPRQDKRLSNVVERDEQGRQDSNNGVNFSRPISFQQSSPITSSPAASAAGGKRYTHGMGSWFSQPSGSGDASNARPKTSDGLVGGKKKPAPIPTEALPVSASYEAEDVDMIYDPNTRTFTAKPRAKPKESIPSSSTLPTSAPLAPGTYDPSTRSIVPTRVEPARTMASGNAMKKQRPSIPPVETKLEPPPRNPARVSPSVSPSSPRAMGFLHKQPSMVREEPEAEDEAADTSPVVAPLSSSSRTIQTSAGPAKAYVAPTRPHNRSASLDVPRQATTGNGSERGRNGSTSPARSAHFSRSPVIEAIRHDPPPRSISPAKSALKHHHSPASSVRTASPMATFSPAGPRAPTSEFSDITSNASEDEPSKKEKKRARVSFDEQPREIDAAGAVSVPKAIVSASGGSTLPIRDRSPAVDEQLESDMMKPRPALPSFGSVGRRVRAGSPPEKVTEMPPERGGMSTDHAIAGILSNAHMRERKDAEVPLPPEEAARKDAEGYATDESEREEPLLGPQMAGTLVKSPSTAQPLKARKLSVDELDLEQPKTRDFATESARQPASSAGHDMDVPAINLQPPTPGDEVGKELGDPEDATEVIPRPRPSLEAFRVPGSWADESSDSKNGAASIPTTHKMVSTMDRIQGILSQPVIQEDERVEAAETPLSESSSSATARQPAPVLDVLDEETDDSAAFSDAAEDLSDFEGEGWGSLDAIVSSPVVSPTVPAEPTKAEALKSPTAQQTAKKQQQQRGGKREEQESGDWTQATAYWSQLTKEKRLQIERQHMSDDEDERPAAPMTGVKKAKKKVAPKSAATAPSGQQQAMPRTLRGQPGPAPAPASTENEVHMRRSMRGSTGNDGPPPAAAAQDDGVHMRRSMRGSAGNANSMPSTMRSGPQQRPQSEQFPQQQRQGVSSRPMSSGGPATSRLGPGGLPLSSGPNRARTDSESTLPGRGSQDSAFPKAPATNKQQPPPRMQRLSANTQQPSTPPGPSGAFTARLQKQVTNDSDFESSFRKKRRRAAQSTADSAAANRYTMKRSMRAGSIDESSVAGDQRPTSPLPEAAAKRGGGAFSIRSLSPGGGGVFGGRGRGERLRESLRSGSVDAGARAGGGGGGGGGRMTLRSNNPPAGPTMRGGKPAATAAPILQRPKFRSRFGADSDDEDEGPSRRGGFRSRFAESDEEDEAGSPPLRAVREIPRRAGQDDGDSTDLDEEDDGGRGKSKAMVPAAADVEKAMEAARRKLGIPEPSTTKGPVTAHETREGGALGRGSLRTAQPVTAEVQAPASPQQQASPGMARPGMPPPEKKKRSFMGSILRRNRSSQQGIPQLPQSPVLAPTSPVVAASSPLHQVSSPQGPSIPSSPSTGKLVRRTSGQPLVMKRGDSSFSTATASPVLNRKTTDNNTNNWPLASPSVVPPVPPIPASLASDSGAHRPRTADGVNPAAIRLARTMRPDIGSRAQSAHFAAADPFGRPGGGGRSVGFAPGSKEEDGEGSVVGGGVGGEGGGEIYSKRTGRKKKFGLLRRAFGLYD
ncbi:hypothetical protein LTR35_008407 [Friedmanniomyces endolithicus]|nr:hypothetical protein LTR35_008407 [Friedmanniomyces endolithicus]KAK0294842.1 hypothetical protein LTS00_006677 [Friedmanniomyces endolithicus]KAK1002165.1 hypothetical protein LTR54_008177 [Friedmanniomyces endolithicus]